MEFEIANNVHCLLQLASGRKIILDKLIQERTYAGLLEGTPDKRVNDRHIEWIRNQAREVFQGEEAYLVEPVRRDYLHEPGDMQFAMDRQQDYPVEFRRPPEWLPMIHCVGTFHSTSPVHDKNQDGSRLVLVWFQNNFGIDAAAAAALRNVDWDRHAVDFAY